MYSIFGAPYRVIFTFLGVLKGKGRVACAVRCVDVLPHAMLGRSWLYIHALLVATYSNSWHGLTSCNVSYGSKTSSR